MRNRTGWPVQRKRRGNHHGIHRHSRGSSVSDLIAYVALIFAIGLAVSLVLAGAVLLLAGQPV